MFGLLDRDFIKNQCVSSGGTASPHIASKSFIYTGAERQGGDPGPHQSGESGGDDCAFEATL
jgi:hypothetical protein